MNQAPFFVYGTLLPEQPNHYLFGTAVQSMTPATLPNGRLYDLGHYPMLVGTPGECVQGVLIAVAPAAYHTILRRLDHLEGYEPEHPESSDYLRAVREVTTGNGRTMPAWVYLGNTAFLKACPIVPHGDWARHVQNKREDVQQWWQTVESVAGLHRSTSQSGQAA